MDDESLSFSGLSYSIIDLIIQRVGPSGSTFLDAFKAYNEVLPARGLDPADDVLYYRFILKLGSIQGSTWSDRWDRWQREHLEHQASTSYASSSRAASDEITVDGRGPTPDHATLAPEAEGSQWDEEARVNLAGLFSPRQDQQRPHPAQDSYDSRGAGAISPPQRMSTPVGATRPRRKSVVSRPPSASIPHYSATPPRSASVQPSVARSVESPYNPSTPFRFYTPKPQPFTPSIPAFLLPQPTARNRKESPPHLQPKARLPAAHPPAPARLPKQVSESRARIEAELQREDEEKQWRLEQERRADAFYESGLVGRCWDVWKRGNEWMITTTAQIDRARSLSLIKSTLSTWRARNARHHDRAILALQHSDVSLARRALLSWRNLASRKQAVLVEVGHEEQRRLVGKTWIVWRGAWEQRRKARWEAEMARREGGMVQAVQTRVARSALLHWRARHLSVVAQIHRNTTVAQSAFAVWRHRAAQAGLLRAISAQSDIERAGRLKLSAFDHWAHMRELREFERVVKAKVESRLVRQAMQQWTATGEWSLLARSFERKRLLKLGLTRMKDRMARIQALEIVADQYRAQAQVPLKRAVFKRWRVKANGLRLASAMENRRILSCLMTWKARLREVDQFEDLAIAFSLERSSTVLSRSFSKWRSRHQMSQELAVAADAHLSRSVARKALGRWRSSTQQASKDAAMAAVASEFLLKRRAWKAWVESTRLRRRNEWVRQKNTERLHAAFTPWVEATRRTRRLRGLGQIISDKRDDSIEASALQQWKARLSQVRAMRALAQRNHDHLVVCSALNSWMNACLRRGEQLSLMQSFRDVKLEDFKRKTFSKWVVLAQTSRQTREEQRAKAERARLDLLGKMWERWTDRLREAQLAHFAEEVLSRQRLRLLDTALATWESKANVATAIHFSKVRAKRAALKRWTEVLPAQRRENAARKMDRQTSLSAAWATWHERTRKKIAARPPPRLSGLSRLGGRPTLASGSFRPVADRAGVLASRSRGLS